ncbi:MAG: glycogen debranching enzyme GlgX, partial [Chloroflexi bacterium]|nr:glycogen debranching enzyme GlgX [Chloroflexota bacterium]
KPYASINFVTCHDGFTLNDLVSYDQKHNEANGESNKDGSDQNFSWNFGVEGPTDSKGILELREKQKRNFLCALIFSQGVPMLCGGDETGRTQRGNNNAYCQDNELTWHDWRPDSKQALLDFIRRIIKINRKPDSKQALLDFTRRIIKINRDHPIFHRRGFFQGRPIRHSEVKDIVWLRPDGQEMTDADWNSSWVRCIGVFYAGEDPNEVDENGAPLTDDTLLVILNSHHDPIQFTLPATPSAARWELLIDTNTPGLRPGQKTANGGESLEIIGRSFALLRHPKHVK